MLCQSKTSQTNIERNCINLVQQMNIISYSGARQGIKICVTLYTLHSIAFNYKNSKHFYVVFNIIESLFPYQT